MGLFAPAGSADVSWLRHKWRRLKLNREIARERRSVPMMDSAAFGVRAGYRHRLANNYFDDVAYNAAPWLEEAQREVYERALQEARQLQAQLVVDVGCGAGKKLHEMFGEFRTIGFDVPETVAKLKATYPDDDWRSAGFGDDTGLRPDIVICADVIEHIPDPDQLLGFLQRLGAKRYFISTPERLRFYGFDHSGPPSNRAHCREWAFDEYEAYLSKWFDVDEHYISNERDRTQLAICRLKGS